jgi:putative pre-16S rRNA nuclease
MILGVDPGDRRVGLAVADERTRFARPLEVIDTRATNVIDRIVRLVDELGVRRVVVGRPLSLSGGSGPAVASQTPLVDALRAALVVEIVEEDERLTTVVAEQGLRAGGAKREAVKQIKDAVAAQVMLQGYLDRVG